MGNLFTSLLNSTNALQVYGRALNVVQNNIANVNTPGYVKQDQVIVALPFDPAGGLPGGVTAAGLFSYRSAYQEQAVRNQQELLGYSEQRAGDLAQLEGQFDLTSQSGIPAALNDFFNGFSELAVNPASSVSRQGVLDRATILAQSFNQAASGIQQALLGLKDQTSSAVATINRIAAEIAEINSQFRANSLTSTDAGLDAQLNAALEDLSKVVNYTLIRTSDGAANVYLGGQTILVIGDHTRTISADFSSTQTVLRDAAGKDITSQATGGRLGALLEEKNTTLPLYGSDLDTLAAGFADAVNAALAAGVDRNGLAPVTNLFTYNPGSAATTLATNALAPDDVAAALPGAPGGNGNAIAISQLGSAPLVGGFSFTQSFGNLGARVGRDIATARQERAQFQNSLVLARQRRSEQSGVSLDEEATKLLQFQQAYQAAGKLVSVLDSLTQTVLNLIR